MFTGRSGPSAPVTRRALLLAAGAAALVPSAAAGAAARSKPIATPFALDEGRILIAAFVDNSGPLLFALDTGAPCNVIFAGAASELHLRAIGEAHISGIGGGSDYPWFTARQVEIGGLRMRDVIFAGLRTRLSESAIGTFGAGLVTTFDSELDFYKSEWRLYPDGPADRTGYRKLPSRFFGGGGGDASKLAVRGSLAGTDLEFIVDTGSEGDVLLSSLASARTRLWDDARPYAPSRAEGIGRATVPGRFVRVPELRVGPFVFEKPIVHLIKPNSPLNDFGADGLIGLGAIRHLNLSIDTKGEALWAAPSGIDVPPTDYPLSGLWLDEAPNGLTVAEVGTGSPAAAAGVRVGDLIAGEKLQPFLKRLGQKAGAVVSFELEQRGQKRRVDLTLRDFL